MSEQDIQTAARALLDANLTGSGDEARRWATIATRALTAERDQLRLDLDSARQSGDDPQPPDSLAVITAHAFATNALMREARASVALDGETVALHDTERSDR